MFCATRVRTNNYIAYGNHVDVLEAGNALTWRLYVQLGVVPSLVVIQKAAFGHRTDMCIHVLPGDGDIRWDFLFRDREPCVPWAAVGLSAASS